MTEKCHDYGDNPACLGDADDSYTMDDGAGFVLHWCSACGPEAHAMANALELMIALEGPARIEAAVALAEEEMRRKAN